MKSKNEKLYKVLMLLGIAIFFLTATKCTAQTDIKRLTHYDNALKHEVTTILPIDGLKFGSPTNIQTDTIHLNIMADSLGVKSYYVKLYAYFPKGVDIKNKAIFIRFDDGTYFKCNQIEYDKEDNYCEYSVPANIYEYFQERKFVSVIFEDTATVVEIKNKDFFKDFFAML